MAVVRVAPRGDGATRRGDRDDAFRAVGSRRGEDRGGRATRGDAARGAAEGAAPVVRAEGRREGARARRGVHGAPPDGADLGRGAVPKTTRRVGKGAGCPPRCDGGGARAGSCARARTSASAVRARSRSRDAPRRSPGRRSSAWSDRARARGPPGHGRARATGQRVSRQTHNLDTTTRRRREICGMKNAEARREPSHHCRAAPRADLARVSTTSSSSSLAPARRVRSGLARWGSGA